jgi:hypothetical protein
MTKVEYNFKEGESGNPNGRPKGSVNATTIKFAKFKALASERYQDAFNILWEAMEAKEGWAHQIFFKELVPKKVHQPTIKVEVEDTTADARAQSIIKELPKFMELTHDEAMNELNVLGRVKVEESILNKANDADFLSDEQLLTVNGWVKDAKEKKNI